MSLPGAETGLSLAATLGPPVAVALIASLQILSTRSNIKAATHHSDELVSILLRREAEQHGPHGGDSS
jgi:hypothetical protein